MQINKVVEGNYCVGCGICAVVSKNINIAFNEDGQYEAYIPSSEKNKSSLDEVCPFTNVSKNENQLSKLFFNEKLQKTKYIGKYISNYAGYVVDEQQRISSSSGGVLSWLLIKLLEKKEIDGVIHVGDFDDTKALMGYKISFTKKEVLDNKKSRYYPIEMSNVLNEIKKNYPNKKFAIVGVPCFIKAVRLLQLRDPFYKNSIKYTFGIVCGHLKTKYFAESYALEKGINPLKIDKIDFRFYQKTDQLASNYSVKINGKSLKNNETIEVIANNNTFYSSDWGKGMFKYNACEFCDDVLAETADITFGDAWLPEYRNEPKGTNLIIVRNNLLLKILNENEQELFLTELSTENVIKSQESGIKHRTIGLKYRLYRKKNIFAWYPKKRYKPSNKNIDKLQKQIFRLRNKISHKSNKAFLMSIESLDFQKFKNSMQPLIFDYEKCYQPPSKKTHNIVKVIYWKITDKFFKK